MNYVQAPAAKDHNAGSSAESDVKPPERARAPRLPAALRLPPSRHPPPADPDGDRQAPPIVREVLNGPGSPLDGGARAAVEGLLGLDLGHVRVHADARAAASAQAVDAAAYAVGNAIVFGAGRYQPEHEEGRSLLVHELVHTLQQRGSTSDSGRPLLVDSAASAQEGEARTIAAMSRHRTGGRRPSTVPVGNPGPAVVARQSVPPPAPVDTAAAGFEYAHIGDDPAVVIADVPRVLANIASIQWDEETRQRGAPPDAVLHPRATIICTESHIVFLGPDGRPTAVTEQDPVHPRMAAWRIAILVEPHSGSAWFLGAAGQRVALKSRTDFGMTPMPETPAGDSQFIVFMPHVVLPPELVRSLRSRAAGGGDGSNDGQDWAHDAVAGARRRLARSRAGGARRQGTGPGAGRQGTGAGGGGGADRATGEAAQADGAPAQPPLRGAPRLNVVTDHAGKPWLRITIDRASTTVELRERDSDAALDHRIAGAVDALQASRDPNAPEAQALADGATRTGFAAARADEAGTVGTGAQAAAQATSTPGAATPSERMPGGPGEANAPAYPATITMAGHGADDPPPITVSGASDAFTMDLNYAALSLGFNDEVFNRMQSVQFYWELIDVTSLAAEAQGPGSAASGALSREFRAIGEDEEADLRMMSEQNWSWDARAAYLGVIGLSNAVRIIGTLIESYVALVTEPLNERTLTFDREGDFLIRCVATPLVDDAARADPQHHVIRASSTAVLPIRVQNIGTRAAGEADKEAKELGAAEAELREAEASGDPRRIADARARVEGLRRASTTGAFDLFTGEIAAVRENIATAERLQRDRAARRAEREWDAPELELQVFLVSRAMTVDQYLPLARARLVALTGDGGSNLDWVTTQHGRMQSVGGHTDFRPRAALASRETGQVIPLRLMLGRLPDPGEGRHRWLLVDFTGAATRDYYSGDSTVGGAAGDAAAIRDCFRNLAENANYGRGTLAIRLPAELEAALGQPVGLEASMEVRPGPLGRGLQRLRDLARAAEVAGVFATGGVGVAIGAVGGVAQAIVSAESLARRARTGHLMEVDTVFDILGIVGGLASLGSVATHVARDVAEAGRAAGRLPSWVNRLERVEGALHIFGELSGHQQMISIPYSLITELDAIDADSSASDGQRRARRALAFLGALRSGAVTVVQASGGIGLEGRATTTAHDDLPAAGRTTAPGPVADVLGSPAAPTHEPSAPARRADDTEAVTGPSPQEVVARAQELARLRLRRGLETATQITGEERGRTTSRDDQTANRTTAGTARPGAREPAGASADVNAPEREHAVRLLGERLGTLHSARSTTVVEPPPPGPFGARTRLAAEAVETYDQVVATIGDREAGLFYNPNTGEFAVQVGTEAEVHGPPGDGWQALVHLHPNPENVIIRRLPAPADIMGSVLAAARTGRHVEFVQSRRPDGSTGVVRVEVTLNPRRILVEMPAEPGEPARRIDVRSPEEYARKYGDETTHLDPTSPLYQWVLRDLDAYYAARRAGSSYGGEQGRTAGGTAAEPPVAPTGPAPADSQPTPWERLAAGRPDVAARFAEADLHHADAQTEGVPPSQRFNQAVDELERAGLGAPGRALIEQMFRPAERSDALSAGRFQRAVGALDYLAKLVRERPDVLTERGRLSLYDSVFGIARDVFAAYRRGETVEGARLRPGDSPELAATMETMHRAFLEYERSASSDPVERLMALLRLREQVARAAEVARSYAPAFTAAVTPGPLATSGLVPGISERPLDVRAAGHVSEPLARDLPGVGLEHYMLSPNDLAELPTSPPGLAKRLSELLRGYHRAHLIGPGFGSELFEGLMLAPEAVNLDAQNKGVELFIRSLDAAGADVSIESHATGRQLVVPLVDGTVEHVDILTRVEYQITVERGDNSPRSYRVVIDVSSPPNGRATVIENTVPPDAPGGDVLRRLTAPGPAPVAATSEPP